MNLNFLKKIEPRMVYLIVASILGLILLASYLYLFKKPMKRYTQLKKGRVALESKVKGKNSSQRIIVNLEKEIAELNSKIYGNNQALPTKEVVAHAIDQLDTISTNHDVQLISVKPESMKLVKLFQEIPFAVQVTGMYFNLYYWLHEVEKQLSPMIVKQFKLYGDAEDEHGLTLSLKLAAYQAVENSQ